MDIFLNYAQYVVLGQLILAAFLGALMGLEREYIGKAAGIRTYALVSLGAALFSMVSIHGIESAPAVINFDPTRIAAQIVVGVGFLGAGLIIFREQKLQGLTTAAGLWISAAVGMAVGFKFYLEAVATTILVIIILSALIKLEDWLKARKKGAGFQNYEE